MIDRFIKPLNNKNLILVIRIERVKYMYLYLFLSEIVQKSSRSLELGGSGQLVNKSQGICQLTNSLLIWLTF